MALHGARVARRHALRVRGEPLVADRRPVLAVRDEQVVARDLSGREQEREPDALRDLEQRAALEARLRPQPAVELRELVRARDVGGVVAQLVRRLPQLLEVAREDSDQTRSRSRAALERTEQVIDGAEPRSLADDAGGL